MDWILKEKEVEELLRSDAKRRYEYFIRRVCGARKVWGLYHEGWATLGDGAKTFIPFWPHAAYAERFRTDEWRLFQAKAIGLEAFLERWLPGMRKDSIEPAIFPVAEGGLATICLDDLEANLRFELAREAGD